MTHFIEQNMLNCTSIKVNYQVLLYKNIYLVFIYRYELSE